jgi:predicted AAA+ superfamily ATPase
LGEVSVSLKRPPQGFIKRSVKTLIVDEVQRIPSLLSAIKKTVDEDTRPRAVSINWIHQYSIASNR